MHFESKDLESLMANSSKLIKDAGLAEKRQQAALLEQKTLQENFWQQADAQEQIQDLAEIQGQIKALAQIEQKLQDLQMAVELQLPEESDRLAEELQKLYKDAEIEQYFQGKYDQEAAMLSIHPGQGGTEAMDWSDMLKRMYQRYFERKGWKYRLTNEIRGEEAGLKEVSFEIEAAYAYGYLKGEQGTHRLVRLSPFNADNLRQTSFALVEVLPMIRHGKEMDIKDSDLIWNFTRAGGAGGQYVNKVSSAVELTHIPTGIVVKCRQERSQIQNREQALKILKAKLAKIEEEKYETELAASKGEHHNASWGTQIRNYVLHPYQLVKDTRTGFESSQTADVLDGDLDPFIMAYIKRDQQK